MIVSRELARQKVAQRIQQALSGVTGFRIRYPGQPEIDVSLDKTPFMNVDLMFTNGWAVGLGSDSDVRAVGSLVTEFNFKDGDVNAYKLCETVLDKLNLALSNTDDMYPVRTYAASPVTPRDGVKLGWRRDSLVTPFWYDTSRV